jgi:ATP-dependent Clp protease adaptor protein ClpS
MLPPQFDPEGATLTESESKVAKPPLFRVLLHNDDYTTMDFVVYVLQSVFQKGEDEAFAIMLNVHVKGIGVAGIYSFEVAEMKVAQVMALAQGHEFPLLCTMEAE